MFTRWWRLDEEGRRDVWRLYGAFTALMCVGSCVGAAAWAVGMLQYAASVTVTVNIRDYPFPQPNPTLSTSQFLSIFADLYSYSAWHAPLYSVEVLCLSIVKLTVLDRMEDFSAPHGGLRGRGTWAKAGGW